VLRHFFQGDPSLHEREHDRTFFPSSRFVIHVTDDIETEYYRFVDSGGGNDVFYHAEIRFEPSPPSGATKLTLTCYENDYQNPDWSMFEPGGVPDGTPAGTLTVDL
jgi:hypothetical protein